MAKKFTAKDIEWIQQISQDAISLNIPVGTIEVGEIPDELIDIIPDDSPTPEEEYCEKEKSEIIDKFIKRYLTEKEQKIVRLRYGLDDGHFRTLEEVGQELGISRQRVNDIEAKAIRKLRFQFSYHKINRGNI